MAMQIHVVRLEKADEVNLILGQAHFIKTVEDLHEALVGAVPGILFGLAFNEASGPALVRSSGTDPALTAQAAANAQAIGAGPVFLVLLRSALPPDGLDAGK